MVLYCLVRLSTIQQTQIPTKPGFTSLNTLGALQAVAGPYMWNGEWSMDVQHIAKGTPPLLEVNALHNPGSYCGSGNEKAAVFQRAALSAALGGRVEVAAMSTISEEALVLFDEMLKKGLEITDRTVVALISACFQMGLVDMCSKCRCLASALKLFDNMRDRNVLTWSTMVAEFVIHDDGKAALKLLEETVKEASPMVQCSYLHRIALCVLPLIYKHEKLGQEIGKILLQLEKGSTSKADNCEDCVALSKMDAAAERWEDVLTLREAMKNNAVHNRPSRSAI
ncbi:hypothetical protein OPV22_026562 [Ensete ventricosum]|uniref:PI4-kinase N-terminal domain-containing protein n=1 Tax=Ensete ventricosum TaxID=4639 RepID=A0AAV8QLX8_ENSVE|nr:hypothetical protein OPV22_026562 [Ensete ventricosum]